MLPKQPSFRQAQLLNKKNSNQASHSTQPRPEISKEETSLADGEKEEQSSVDHVVPPKVRHSTSLQNDADDILVYN
jgi:hypothetical protein